MVKMLPLAEPTLCERKYGCGLEAWSVVQVQLLELEVVKESAYHVSRSFGASRLSSFSPGLERPTSAETKSYSVV